MDAEKAGFKTLTKEKYVSLIKDDRNGDLFFGMPVIIIFMGGARDGFFC